MYEEFEKLLNDQKQIIRWPTKKDLKFKVIEYIGSKFEFDINYSEKEVNDVIKKWFTFNDYVLVRREMIVNNIMGRRRDGSIYWKIINNKQP